MNVLFLQNVNISNTVIKQVLRAVRATPLLDGKRPEGVGFVSSLWLNPDAQLCTSYQHLINKYLN